MFGSIQSRFKSQKFSFQKSALSSRDIVEISKEDAPKINGNFLISVSDLAKEETAEIQVAEANKDVDLLIARELPVIDDSKKKKPKARTLQVEQ